MLKHSRSLRSAISIAILALAPMALAEEATDAPASSEQTILTGQAFDDAERLYQTRCGACHSLDHNRVGPQHRNVYGAQAGSVPDFRYSRALRELDTVWTAENLDLWLQSPPRFARGTSMGFSLRRDQERETIINYLRSVAPMGAVKADSGHADSE